MDWCSISSSAEIRQNCFGKGKAEPQTLNLSINQHTNSHLLYDHLLWVVIEGTSK